jgi:RNA polymerase sigma factor (sigma-70 family)
MARGTTVETWNQFLDCSDSLARYIRRQVRNRDDAAELFQELSLLVLRNSRGPQPGATFDSWCRGLARHILAHHFRSKRRRASLLDRAGRESHDLESRDLRNPERECAAREVLERAFAGIDASSSRMVIERYLLGDSAEEIGTRLARSPSAVRMKLMRIREALMNQQIER